MSIFKRALTAVAASALIFTGVQGVAFAAGPTTVATTSSNGCTARIMKEPRVVKSPKGNVTIMDYYATIACPNLAKGKQARARAACVLAPDRYTSWAVRGESWQSGNCFGSTANKVTIQVR